MGRAALFHGPGQVLELVDQPVPRPGDREILVRITCCTLCRSDLHTHAGRRAEPTPAVLGHEIVGRIEAFGPSSSAVDAAGTSAQIGDRVTWAVVVGCGRCFFCTRDLPQKCERLYKYGHVPSPRERPGGGGLADHILLVPGTVWYRVPDALSDPVAAPANCATATVAAVVRQAGPMEGRHVLIFGAGMLGVTACAMAQTAGARSVIVSDRVATNRTRALAFGATHATSAEVRDLNAEVARITDGRGADVILELAGLASTVESALALARVGGTVVLAGTVAPVGSVPLDPETVVRRLLTIRGVHNYHPHDLHTALGFLAGAGRAFPFETMVGAAFALEEAEEAFTHAGANPGVRIAVLPSRASVRERGLSPLP